METPAPWKITGIVCLAAVAGCSPSDSTGQDESPAATTAEVPRDLPGGETHGFQCDNLGSVETRFLGPDTIEVSAAGQPHVMQRQRAASGARYSGDGAEFWNKGEQAMVMIGDRHFKCARIDTNDEVAER